MVNQLGPQKYAVVAQGTKYYHLVKWDEWIERGDAFKKYLTSFDAKPFRWKTQLGVRSTEIMKYVEAAPEPQPVDLENLRDPVSALQMDPATAAFRAKLIADLELNANKDGKRYEQAKPEDDGAALRSKIEADLASKLGKQQ